MPYAKKKSYPKRYMQHEELTRDKAGERHRVEHVFEEKERIGKLAQIRELVFGAQDGLLVPLGVISSVAGAFSNNHIVLVAGISEALAGAFSMGTGAYLSSQAERQVQVAAIEAEKAAIERHPEEEEQEMVLLLEREGVPKEEATTMARRMFQYQTLFTNTMVQKELGLDPEPPDTPLEDALYVGLSYLGAAIIPLFPYFFISGMQAIITSILLTFVALFCIGMLKGRFASLPYLKSGLQVLLVGAGSGIGGYFLGTLLPKIVGV